MNKKAFTVIEVLAVIVILGIISTIATANYAQYRETVKDKEKGILRHTLTDAFNNYRTDKITTIGATNNHQKDCILQYNANMDKIKDYICSDGLQNYTKYFGKVSYDGNLIGKKIEDGDPENGYYEKSYIIFFDKGSLLKNEDYIKANPDYVNDGTCLVNSTVKDGEGEEGPQEITNECVVDSDGNRMPSKAELICMKIYKENNKTGITTLINDFEDNDSLCRYFK